MKRIGIVGGLGPASTVDYYNALLAKCRTDAQPDVYPEILIDSINMQPVVKAISESDLPGVAALILASLTRLSNAGVNFAAIASNSPHVAWDLFAPHAPIPLLSIMEAAGQYIQCQRYSKVLILATKFTMRNGLYSKYLTKLGIESFLPSDTDMEIIGNLIYPNLENGIVIADDKKLLLAISEKYLKKYQCDSLLLGCTELPLMIRPGDVSVPLIDTTQIHVNAIAKYALQDGLS